MLADDLGQRIAERAEEIQRKLARRGLARDISAGSAADDENSVFVDPALRWAERATTASMDVPGRNQSRRVG